MLLTELIPKVLHENTSGKATTTVLLYSANKTQLATFLLQIILTELSVGDKTSSVWILANFNILHNVFQPLTGKLRHKYFSEETREPNRKLNTKTDGPFLPQYPRHTYWLDLGFAGEVPWHKLHSCSPTNPGPCDHTLTLRY